MSDDTAHPTAGPLALLGKVEGAEKLLLLNIAQPANTPAEALRLVRQGLRA